MTAAALVGLFCGATVAAPPPLTRCVLALSPFERDCLARKDPR